MNKAPSVIVDGKIGRWGGRVNTKFEGHGAITKNHGHYMLKASLTATQAHKLEELAKRVPATEEARTRADMGIRPFAKGDDAYIARHQGQTTDTIKIQPAAHLRGSCVHAGTSNRPRLVTRGSGGSDHHAAPR